MKTLFSIILFYILCCGIYKNYEMVKDGSIKCFLINHNFINSTVSDGLRCKVK